MAYKPFYDEAYLKSLISQIRKLNQRKLTRRRSDKRASEVPKMNFTESQKAAAVILKNIKNKKKGDSGVGD